MQDSLVGMLPLVLMFVVLYFVMIRPQMKKQKEHKSMIDALAKGDEVVTAGGVLGKVSKLGDGYLGLEVANGVEIQIQRSAVVPNTNRVFAGHLGSPKIRTDRFKQTRQAPTPGKRLLVVDVPRLAIFMAIS